MQDSQVGDITVLVIEDDADIAEMYRLRLNAEGYSVVIAADGREGLRIAVDERPDFIYLDIRLPGLDGFEVLEQLQRFPTMEDIPVVILSNYEDQELRERGLQLGALEFLVKADTTPSRLTQAIQRSMSRGGAAAREQSHRYATAPTRTGTPCHSPR